MAKEVQWSVMLLVGVLCQGALGVLAGRIVSSS